MSVTPEAIALYYREPVKRPLELAKMIRDYHATGITHQQLARETGMSPGTVHHYESLLRLPPELQAKVAPVSRGTNRRHKTGAMLTFKEARALADLPTQAAMTKHAAPFLDGRLSGSHVERYIAIVKASPDIDTAKAVDMVLNPTKYQTHYKLDVETAVPPPPEPEQVVTPDVIKQASVNFRALLGVARWDTSIDALMACRELERLKSEITRVLDAQKAATA